VLWLLRTDKESATLAPKGASESRADWLDEPSTLLRGLCYRLIGAVRHTWLSRAARPLLMRVYAPLARQRLRRGVEMLASARVVITDRLHGHILSVLLGIPHVILDNSYGKLSSFYDTWMTEVDNVHRADSPTEAVALAEQLANVLPAAAVVGKD
jgi:pyruvyl transferase EpsO